MQGKRRPVAGSAYAQAIIELARLDPPKPAPPLPLVALDPLWVRDGVFVRSLSSFHGDKRDAASAAEFSCIYVQLDHSGDVGGNIAELHAIGPCLMAQGWRFAGWSTYGQGTDPSAGRGQPREDPSRARRLPGRVGRERRDLGGRNRRVEVEGVDRGVDSQRRLRPRRRLCMSSDNPNYARAFDYAVVARATGLRGDAAGVRGHLSRLHRRQRQSHDDERGRPDLKARDDVRCDPGDRPVCRLQDVGGATLDLDRRGLGARDMGCPQQIGVRHDRRGEQSHHSGRSSRYSPSR